MSDAEQAEWPLRVFETCGSTSDIAREWAVSAIDPAPDGAVVTAMFQTAGRGRRGHAWQSRPGDNLLLSVILRPSYPLSESWRLGFVAAVAVAEAVDRFGVTSALKWPNDVLIAGRKTSGILVEAVPRPVGWAAIVGIGVNVNQSAFDVDESFELLPTSLRIERGEQVALPPVRDAVLGRLRMVERLNRSLGFAAVASAWQLRMASGLEIRRGAERGIQDELLEDGRVRVRLADGTFAAWATVDGDGSTNSV